MTPEQRLEVMRARGAVDSGKPAPKRPGDNVGRILVGPGITREVAILLAAKKPWWPRIRAKTPKASAGWWVWPLKPEGAP